MESTSLAELAEDAAALVPERGRAVLGLAGPPGAGKSTLAGSLVAALGEVAAYVPLDGFHLSNAQLDRLGLRSRKGSEPSFDALGYAALLARLLAAAGREEVYVPDFDRSLDEPVAARHRVAADVRLVVTEGNYLALDAPGWRQARALIDQLWYVDAPEELRDARLVARHRRHGRSSAEARAWVDSNDRPNALLVAASRGRCDRVVLTGSPATGAAGESHPYPSPETFP
ncbi:nucleoside/nucleotide kinase family protein [Streptomyces triticirhizae]|uniref:Nucleoside/nucleotide kinase family protein n=1 Tax=Streptomyces triticirhizae TaxID=2483353 RepID=A0A3M2LAS2_9ACTN|nr:nucleoside/nucleotide kinase family protein [Streptomyces triticirhizae]RMI34524.1 nucleoside/nucleotide kinase family protein [Streptomyces triticirhizae]